MAIVGHHATDPLYQRGQTVPEHVPPTGGNQDTHQDDDEALLRTAEVARLLQVSTRTVLAWAQAGKLPSVLTPGGHRRYPRWAVDEVLETMTGGGDSIS